METTFLADFAIPARQCNKLSVSHVIHVFQIILRFLNDLLLKKEVVKGEGLVISILGWRFSPVVLFCIFIFYVNLLMKHLVEIPTVQ